MAENKIVKSRMIQKHDVEANWAKAGGFIPFKGEVIIYDADENNLYPRMKVGDGVTTVHNLPFVSASVQIKEWEAGD